MARKTLLVLGASRYQLDAIRRAQRLGYRVVTADNNPDNPGHLESDGQCTVDTTDTEGVLDLAVREKISGVISPCTDVAVTTAAIVAEQLGLPGVPVEATQIVTDKSRFRSWMRSQGLPCPQVQDIGPDSDVPETWFQSGPGIVKPARSSGSKGITIVASRDEFLRARPAALGYSLDGRGVLERFLHGTQGTCEGILESGRVTFACVTDRLTVAAPYVATSGHVVPTSLDPKLQHGVVEAIADVWLRLGVRDGTFDCDFVVDATGQVHLIELSPRLGGNSMSTLVQAAYGVDLVTFAVRAACGDHERQRPLDRPVPSAQLILGVDRPGSLWYDHAEAQALAQEAWLKSFHLDCHLGTPVQPFINGRCRVGEALIQADTKALLETRVIEFRKRLGLCAIEPTAQQEV